MIREDVERHVCIKTNGAIEYQSILDRGAWTQDEKNRILALVEEHMVEESGKQIIDWPGVWREWDGDKRCEESGSGTAGGSDERR